MSSQRRLKYSVSDASRRMYIDENNGTYRKLQDGWLTESQLRQQKFDARRRPLSHTLGSNSFRETVSYELDSGSQTLINLKKARSRNSLNLPHSFSLDVAYDVNANPQLDDFVFGNNKDPLSVRTDASAFDFVPEKDIVSLVDYSEPQKRRKNSKCDGISNTSNNGKIDLTSNNFKRKTASASSSSQSSDSDSSSVNKCNTCDIERVLEKGTAPSKPIQKRPSFKEVFPEKLNREFLDKSPAGSSDRRSSFTSLISDGGVHYIFDSDIHLKSPQRKDIDPDPLHSSAEIGSDPLLSSTPTDSDAPPLPETLPPEHLERVSLGSLVWSDSTEPKVNDDQKDELVGKNSIKSEQNATSMASEGVLNEDEGPMIPPIEVAYYGPVYAKNNTLILPPLSKDFVDDKPSASDEKEEMKQCDSREHRTEISTEKSTSSSEEISEETTQVRSDCSDDEKCKDNGDNVPIENMTDREKSTQENDTKPTCVSQYQTFNVNADVHNVLETLDNAILGISVDDKEEPKQARHRGHFVVVAIDFGTTYSGYAFSFTKDPSSIHMMRKWEGGDPGVINDKTLTSILLTPEGQFHSFGFCARDNYHDLDKDAAQTWMYFDKFKMILHNTPELSEDTLIKASNGRLFPAMTVFSLALRYFKDHATQELSDQSGVKILSEDIRWVISVPAIWKASAKQFMRQAAYEGELVGSSCPEQLVIALEPEAASIYCRKLKMYQLIPEKPIVRPLQSPKYAVAEPMNMDPVCDDLKEGSRYMVVDCGGGTVDITVHQVDKGEKLIELYRASGGPYGSVGIDLEFENVLDGIFGKTLMDHYREKCPVGWIDLMIAFESRKRSASPYKTSSLNVSLPFSFIDFYKKHKGGHIETAVKKHGVKDIQWSRLGMLRFSPDAMRRLFIPTIDRIKQAIGDVMNDRGTRDLQYLFLVGGFAESGILQNEIRKAFGYLLKVIIPQGVGLAILKGSVLFGLDPTVVHIRKSRLTYGVGVLNKFNSERHPTEKRVYKGESEWCMDVFDKYVLTNQPIALGDVVLRSYKPATSNQKKIQINVYHTEDPKCEFITDKGIQKCGVLSLDLLDESGKSEGISLDEPVSMSFQREIQTRMVFGETEIKVSALDVTTGKGVQAIIDFLNT